jgi:hypothetical protein
MRNTSTPDWINWPTTASVLEAGPIVATIFVRLCQAMPMRMRVCAEGDARSSRRREASERL